MAPRLIRRRPLGERIKSSLDPVEFLLWLSEKFESSEWDDWQKQWTLPIAIFLNLCFLIARANSGTSIDYSRDAVFGDDDGSIEWSAWFSFFIVYSLVVLAFVNAFYTFWRHRHYRLFEKSVDTVPSTPSARRVRVNSSPVSSSPLRFLSSVLIGDNAESRAHPDQSRDVWEISVWDPTPMSLNLICSLSPGHALIYLSFLPTVNTDPRPSTTVATAVLLGLLLSVQLYLLRSSFSQQSKDSSLIHKEVMNEYDTKFVHPRTQHMMRDVGTQFSSRKSRHSGSTSVEIVDEDVDTYAPTYIINKGFNTNPNPAYAKHIDAEIASRRPASSTAVGAVVSMHTPMQSRNTLSPKLPQTTLRQPQLRASLTGDGGSLGVFSHASSPLRKSTPSGFLITAGSHERATSPQKYGESPLKRNRSTATSYGHGYRPK